MAKKQCKTCKNFTYLNWINMETGEKEEKMNGGNCDLFQKILSMDNPNIYMMKEKLYIQDTFGCIFHVKKQSTKMRCQNEKHYIRTS